MNEEKKKEVIIRVERLVYGGDSLSRLPDGKAIFIPFCVPGELVRAEVIEERQGHSKGSLLEVLEPSPDRVLPRCMHYGVCGGCHYQHLSYDNQLKAKEDILRDQFLRIADIKDLPLTPSVRAPMTWNYRNTVQFHLTPLGKIGYHRQSSSEIIPILECYLPEPYLNDLWPLMDIQPFPGLRRVELRLGEDEDVLLVLESSMLEPPQFELEMPLSAVFRSPQGETVLAGEDFIWMQVKERLFKVSSGSFFQVNTLQAGAMVEHLLNSLPIQQAATILDVYCGVGLFSAFLAPRVDRLVAIESASSACQDFITNLDEFDNVELYESTAETVLPALSIQPQIAIVDPPRSGMERQALEALVSMQPEWLAYVSCDPATLCRDTRRLLTLGYHLQQVTLFDLFPQTYHLESISIFHK